MANNNYFEKEKGFFFVSLKGVFWREKGCRRVPPGEAAQNPEKDGPESVGGPQGLRPGGLDRPADGGQPGGAFWGPPGSRGGRFSPARKAKAEGPEDPKRTANSQTTKKRRRSNGPGPPGGGKNGRGLSPGKNL